MDYKIKYEGKASEADIIGMTPAASLSALETIGGEGTNYLIKGDNLTALKRLYEDEDIRGNVDLIYIDPPYSTQRVFSTKAIYYRNDVDLEKGEHAYEDKLSGAEYLEFIRERLVFLRELLSDEGAIYVHLDDKSAFSVKVIMDEVFGERNFRNWITRRKCSSKNYTRNKFGNITDYIICYSKSGQPTWNRPYSEWEEDHAAKEYPKVEEETGRRFKLVPIYAQGERNGETGKPWKGMDPPEGKHWFTTPDKLDDLEEDGRIYWSRNGNPRKKVYLDESDGVPYTDLWMDFRDAHNQNVSVTGYPTEKNVDMLEMIVEASSNEGDLVIDCFCGSGTTLEAASKLGRRWIGIDSSDLAIDVCKKRLEEVARESQASLFDRFESGFTVYEASVNSEASLPSDVRQS